MILKAIRAALAACLLVLSFAASPAHAQGTGVQVAIKRVDTEEFPTVRVIASLPEGADPAEAMLIENGITVADLEAEALRTTDTDVEVVLAIDTSDSMSGQPIEAAIAAARNFIDTMPSDIAIGIVGFSDAPEVLAPISTDREAALEALSAIDLERRTSLYDGITTAAELFSSDAQRNILLLSDGADVGSTATLAEAITSAQEAQANVFAVGLESGVFDEPALRKLAVRTDGAYESAATGDLTALFEDVSRGIQNQYVLTYESGASLSTQIGLQLAAGSESDSAIFLAPEEIDRPPVINPPDEGFEFPLKGTVGLVIVLGLIFLSAFAVAIALVGANLRAKRDRELARRMAVTSDHALDEDEAEKATMGGWIPQPLVDVANSFTEDSNFKEKVDKQLEQAGIPVKAAEFLAAGMLGGAIGFILSGLIFGNLILMIVFTALGAYVPKVLLSLAVSRRRAKLQGQLPDILMILASSLRAGHSFFQAIDMVAKEIGDPGAEEFGRVVAEIRLGRAVDEALISMGERIGSEDFKWAVLAVNIQRDVGGNLAEVLDTVADTLREREVIRRQVKVLSAEGRLSMYILTGLPVLVALYISRVNPGYLNLLFSTGPGRVMLATGIALLGIGILWMQKIVRINV